ncbi:MAG TPA: B12-binding domain-containing protein, partial [Gaiellaceae bacterium]|nr:B12-binding domain-containing protein [Gaiellaceae bacterium]
MEQAVDRTEQRELASALRGRRDLLATSLGGAGRTAHGAPGESLARDLVDALAAAVELGSVDGFVHFARATAEIGEPRGISRAQLDRTLAGLREQLAVRFAGPEIGTARSALDAARLAIEAASFESRARRSPSRGTFAHERAQYTQAALAARWQTAYSLVGSLLADGHALLDIYADLIAESLYEVGRRWARAEISVADQHVATAVSEYVLSRLYTRFPAAEPPRGAAVVACAPTEAHQTGAHIVADALELDGWDVRFLGANAAAREVARAVEASEASLVAV